MPVGGLSIAVFNLDSTNEIGKVTAGKGLGYEPRDSSNSGARYYYINGQPSVYDLY